MRLLSPLPRVPTHKSVRWTRIRLLALDQQAKQRGYTPQAMTRPADVGVSHILEAKEFLIQQSIFPFGSPQGNVIK
jgi:hypothetical protein